MIVFNKIIAFLYLTNKVSMKYSNNRVRVFFAKVVLALVLFFWLLVIQGLLSLLFGLKINLSNIASAGKFESALILIVLYFIINAFTWNTEQLEKYVSNPENEVEIKSAKKALIILFVGGFVLSMGLAIYNH
jgi:steroid 5-alpha reductase family enzyme